MNKEGKILFYDRATGKGIIITQDQHKYQFYIGEWNDFNTMPEVGVYVAFTLVDETPTNILLAQEPSLDEMTSQDDKIFEDFLEPLNDKQEYNAQVRKTHRYHNSELTDTEDELVTLLNDADKSLEKIDDKINVTYSIAQTMQYYFKTIRESLQKRMGYKKVDGRLNYLLAKRFLWTTFNNLKEIDPHVVSLRIKSVSDDLEYMDRLEVDFSKKTRYPALAFEEIFLSYQKEYKYVQEQTKKIKEKLNALQTKEKTIDSAKKKKQRQIDNEASKEKKELLIQELKVLNGTYVDIIHMLAQLQDEYKYNTEKMYEFEHTYQEAFAKEFHTQAQKYKHHIIDILDAQAYLLDVLLWREAKTSKAIRAYFSELPVDVELNTKEYLKYYLSTLDEQKISDASKELFELYEHLLEVHRDYIMVVCYDAHDAIDYESALHQGCEKFAAKAFIDELKALKWAVTHSVKYIVIEESLRVATAQKFLDSYHDNIFSKPKIIVIGTSLPIHSKKYVIDKRVASGISPQALRKEVQKVIEVS